MQNKSQVGAKHPHQGGRRPKYVLDERQTRLMNDLYDGTRERVDLLAREIGLPREIIKRIAYRMHITKSSAIWSPEEEEFLRKNIHRISMEQMKKSLKRDRATIYRKAHALRLFREYEGSGYTLADLKLLFGFDKNANASIYTWIKKGWLKGRKIVTKFHTEQWEFSCKNIRDFVLAHPEQVNPKRFDWIALANILADGEGIGRLDGAYQRGEEEC